MPSLVLFYALDPEKQEPDRLSPDFMKMVDPGFQHKSVDPAPTFFPLCLEPGLLGEPPVPWSPHAGDRGAQRSISRSHFLVMSPRRLCSPVGGITI